MHFVEILHLSILCYFQYVCQATQKWVFRNYLYSWVNFPIVFKQTSTIYAQIALELLQVRDQHAKQDSMSHILLMRDHSNAQEHLSFITCCMLAEKIIQTLSVHHHDNGPSLNILFCQTNASHLMGSLYWWPQSGVKRWFIHASALINIEPS